MNRAYELDLVERCLRFEPKAQRLFYDYYKGKLMGLCSRYSKNKDDAEDIFQEAFVKIFKQLHTLDKVELLNAWIKRIVINTAINYQQAQLKYQTEENIEAIDIEDEHSMRVLSHLTTEKLLEFIQKLPDGYRVVFNMHVIDGYSHTEIGEILNISEGTSKSQLARAKNYLRNKFIQLGITEYETYGRK